MVKVNNMGLQFRAEENPSSELISALATLSPGNPFYSSGYISYKARNFKIITFIMLENNKHVGGCIGM